MIEVLGSGFGRGVRARLERVLFGPGTLFLLFFSLMLASVLQERVWDLVDEFSRLSSAWRWGLFLALLLFLLAFSWFLELWLDAFYLWLMGLGLPDGLYAAGVRRWRKRVERLQREKEVIKSFTRENTGETAALASRRLGVVELELRHIPPPYALLPTAFGNVLRAANEHVRLRYGLDPVVLWPHLWSRLPRDEKRELKQAKGFLDNAVEAVFLGLLLFFFGILFIALEGARAWPLPLLGLGFFWLAYRLAVERAKVFGELVRAAFDLHRRAVYEAVGFEPPSPLDGTSAREKKECEQGRALTRFLWRGPQRSRL